MVPAEAAEVAKAGSGAVAGTADQGEQVARGDRVDRLERMTNLVLVLLETKRPLTIHEIADTVAGYPKGEAGRQAFERDKKAIRELGMPLSIEGIEADTQVGYRIKPEDYYLPDLGLDDSEGQALAFAIAAVQLGGAAGADAIAKLGGPLTEAAIGRAGLGRAAGPGVAPVAVLPSLPQLGPIHEALRSRAVLAFRYHGRAREVEPYGLTLRAGTWYLVGRDRAAAGGAAMRTFRVDRFESSPQVGEGGEFDPPAGYDLRDAVRFLPWSTPDPEAEVPVAEVVVDARMARVVAAQVPADAITAFEPDGSVRLSLAVGDVEAFVSFVVGLGDTALVVKPVEMQTAVVDRLTELARESTGESAGIGGHLQAPPRTGAPAPPRTGAPAPPRTGAPAPAEVSSQGESRRNKGQQSRFGGTILAGERLRRLLAILVYLDRVGEAQLSEVASRFSIGEAELVHELELASCCGVPPYTPDQLIELFVDGDMVVAERLREFARPQALTPEEGFVLAAAARALLAVPGADEEGALKSALAKLEDALGAARIAVDIEQPPNLVALKDAASERAQVEIEYFGSAAAVPSTRIVDPYQVVLREGRWYLDGWCHSAGGLRRFQVDRVNSVGGTGETFEAPEGLEAELTRPGAFLGGPDAVKATVVFPAGAELAVEQVAAGPVEPASDGRLVATILVGDIDGWFGRLLLRLGPGTEVLAPPELREAGSRMARRALARYTNQGGNT